MTQDRITEAEHSEADLTGPGGWGFKYRGSNQLLLVVILILMLFGGLGFGLWQHDAGAAERSVKSMERDAATSAAIKDLSNAVSKQERKLDVMIYVLTLSDAERKALQLDKPQALRDMQGR